MSIDFASFPPPGMTGIPELDREDREEPERPTPYPNKTTFGPGALESITLVSWVANHTRWVRVKGEYAIYCGLGNQHTVEVDERAELTYVGCFAPEDVAHWLVGQALQDWFDPCDEDES